MMASQHLEKLIDIFRPTERKILYALVLTLGTYLITRIYFIETGVTSDMTFDYRVGLPLPVEGVGGIVEINGDDEDLGVTGFFYRAIVANFIFWYIVSAIGDRFEVSIR